jgi:uncharacterized protein GlcG (DUF336 family)
VLWLFPRPLRLFFAAAVRPRCATRGFSLQQEGLNITALTLQTATTISQQALAAGRAITCAPLTIAVLDAGGQLITLLREDGASMLWPQIAIGKAWCAVAVGKASRLIGEDAQQRPSFISAVNTLAHGNLIPAPGGVLLRDEQNAVIGAIGISADTSDIDEQCAIKGILAVGLQADAG